jgi:thiamine-phosphate pyrophosphorylase
MAQHSSTSDSVPSGLNARVGRIRGCYAILDRDDEALARALLGAAAVLQVRLKPARTCDVLAAARMARRVTRELGALLIVNDRLDVALAVHADGVHVGQEDLPLADVRRLAPDLIVGVSTHDLAQVRAAVAGGADYLGFGPVFPTTTKENPDPVVGLEGLAAAVAAAGRVPVVAIGGIRLEHAAAIAATGAAAACAIGAVNQASAIGVAARTVARAWLP